MKERDLPGRRNNTINTHADYSEYYYPRTHSAYSDSYSRHSHLNSSSVNNPTPTSNTEFIPVAIQQTNSNLSGNSGSNSTPTDTKAISPDRRHRRNFSSFSAFSASTEPLTPQQSLQDYWPASPFTKYSSPERPSKQHSRFPSSFDYAAELSPFPFYQPSPDRKLAHPLLTTTHSDRDNEESIYPRSAIKSPDRSKRREKNVSFCEDPFTDKSRETREPFTSERMNNEKIPQVTPSRPIKMQESSGNPNGDRPKSDGKGNSVPSQQHVISTGSHGVEVALKSSTEKNGPYSMLVRSDVGKKKNEASDPNKNDTPPREKTGEKGKKVTVITPQEGQNHGHSRSPSYNTIDFHNELPSVPDSPYSPFPSAGYASYPQSHPPSFQGFPSPNKPALKSPRRGERTSEEHSAQYPPYSPHFGYHYPPAGYEDSYREGYREMPSPGKRQRMNAGAIESDYHPGYPDSEQFHQESYQRYLNRPGRDNYSESFDSDSAGQKYPIPPVSKAPSYPPPPSPSRYGAPPESGSQRPNEAEGDYPPSHGYPPYRGHAPPQSYPYEYHDGYYPDSRPRSRLHEMPSASGHPRPPHPYYYHETQGPHDEVHPLLRDYDPERDRRSAAPPQSEAKKHFSPDRVSVKDGESIATTPSLKSRTSKATSPNKRKPSTAAKAAIAAGMTQPQAAAEIDFDIHNPPLEPVTPPSKEAVCSLTSSVNNDDVLCGRGGGTNTQIGNRKFRALVQEFQPTYLLCRRKEKPLIARTIVLIIRNRGGRFLKKDEGNGMLFEVGDEKAEAKTSQALREGLDVRASKSTTLLGRKQKRAAEKKKMKETLESISHPGSKTVPQSHDHPMSESPMRSQRDPPPQQEYSQYPPPPPYYYGYSGQYPPYYGYEPNPAYSSPSRKRQRSPHAESMYYPPAPYNHKGYQPYSYPPDYHYPNYPPPSQPQNEGEENVMWENEFNPPRGPIKKEDARLKGDQ